MSFVNPINNSRCIKQLYNESSPQLTIKTCHSLDEKIHSITQSSLSPSTLDILKEHHRKLRKERKALKAKEAEECEKDTPVESDGSEEIFSLELNITPTSEDESDCESDSRSETTDESSTSSESEDVNQSTRDQPMTYFSPDTRERASSTPIDIRARLNSTPLT